MEIKDIKLKKLKDILEEEFGQQFSGREVFDSAQNLVGFFDVLMKWDKEKLMKGKNEKI